MRAAAIAIAMLVGILSGLGLTWFASAGANGVGSVKAGAWTAWPEEVRRREPKALVKVAAESGRTLAEEQVLQFAFAMQ